MNDNQFKIGLIQMEVLCGDTQKTLTTAEKMIRQAANQGAKLICLPELFYEEYDANTTNKMTSVLSSLCRELSIHIVAGYAEKSTVEDAFYNSVLFLDDKGSIIGNKRKVYLNESDKLQFSQGDSFPVYQTVFGKIGILISYEISFPEPSRIMALRGAELIIIPSIWKKEYRRHWELNLASNALFNQLYIAGVNGVDNQSCGCSQIISPNGIVLATASSDEAEVLICEINRDEILASRIHVPYMNDFKKRTFSSPN